MWPFSSAAVFKSLSHLMKDQPVCFFSFALAYLYTLLYQTINQSHSGSSRYLAKDASSTFGAYECIRICSHPKILSHRIFSNSYWDLQFWWLAVWEINWLIFIRVSGASFAFFFLAVEELEHFLLEAHYRYFPSDRFLLVEAAYLHGAFLEEFSEENPSVEVLLPSWLLSCHTYVAKLIYIDRLYT